MNPIMLFEIREKILDNPDRGFHWAFSSQEREDVVGSGH